MLTLLEAAAILKINPETLRRHAKAGLVESERIGRLYRFHPDRLYNVRGPAPAGEESCQSVSEEIPGGLMSPSAAKELDSLLEQLTAPPRKNSTMNLKHGHGEQQSSENDRKRVGNKPR